MTPEQASALEAFVNLHYAMFLQTLRGNAATLTPLDRKSPASIRALSNSSYRLASSFVTGLRSIEDTPRRTELVKDFSRILAQNVAQTVNETKFGAQAPPGPTNGAMGLLALRKPKILVYRATDSAGRVWDASVLVAFLVRDFLYQSQIDEQIATAKSEGVTTVIITHLGTGNEFTGKSMSLAAMIAQRKTIFHPNSGSGFKY